MRIFLIFYWIRVPLLTLLVLAVLGFAANFGPMASLLANLFDQGQSSWGVCSVCYCAFLLAAVCIVCINLVLYYGPDRFDDSNALSPEKISEIYRLKWEGRLAREIAQDLGIGDRTIAKYLNEPGPQTNLEFRPVVLLGVIPPFVFAGFVWHGSPGVSPAARTWAIALALLFAMITGLLAKVGQLMLWNPDQIEKCRNPPDLVIPVALLDRLGIQNRIQRVQNRIKNVAPLDWLWRGMRFLPRLARYLGPGFAIKVGDEPYLRSGHDYAFFLAVITFFLWWGFGWCKHRALSDAGASAWIVFFAGLPAIAWALIFLMLACWVLSLLAFLLDRFRFPLLLAVCLLALITTLVPKSDHFFHVAKSPNNLTARFRTPSDVLKARAALSHKRFVLISTAGGGIQAAAWTARVLTGLQAREPLFRSSILLISSVSGGSVGSMGYARTFDRARPKGIPSIGDDTVARTEAGALDAIAWGWFNPDVVRAVLPWFRDRLVDRAWSIERAWTATFQLAENGETMLGDWAEQAWLEMPALLFNAAIAETGHPVVFSNTRFPANVNGSQIGAGIQNFHTLYRQAAPYSYDLPVVSAARLSASFPYVAPAARSDLFGPAVPDYHFVDGGYYDNYGITTLIAWLEEALPACSDCEFLLLRITHFPVSNKPETKKHGWVFQLYAPIAAQYDAREAGQIVGDDTQVRFKADVLNLHGRIRLYGAAIGYDPGKNADPVCLDPPLSWQLSQRQKNCIASSWQLRVSNDGDTEFQCIADFVSNKPKPRCKDLSSSGLSEETGRAAEKLGRGGSR
jgi:hypothetical protein